MTTPRAGLGQGLIEQQAPVAQPLEFRMDTQVQQVRLAGRPVHHGVAREPRAGLQTDTNVASAQAIREDATCPGKRVTGLLDLHHPAKVPRRQGTDHRVPQWGYGTHSAAVR